MALTPGPRPIGEIVRECIADTRARMEARRLFERGDQAVIDFVADIAGDPETGAAVVEALHWQIGTDDIGRRHRVPRAGPGCG